MLYALAFAYALETVKILLKAGAKVNVKDNDGKTAMDLATNRRDKEKAVPLLLTYACKMLGQVKDSSLSNLLSGIDPDLPLVLALLEKGLKPTAKDGETM
jgi:ankyrin repeat protein